MWPRTIADVFSALHRRLPRRRSSNPSPSRSAGSRPRLRPRRSIWRARRKGSNPPADSRCFACPREQSLCVLLRLRYHRLRRGGSPSGTPSPRRRSRPGGTPSTFMIRRRRSGPQLRQLLLLARARRCVPRADPCAVESAAAFFALRVVQSQRVSSFKSSSSGPASRTYRRTALSVQPIRYVWKRRCSSTSFAHVVDDFVRVAECRESLSAMRADHVVVVERSHLAVRSRRVPGLPTSCSERRQAQLQPRRRLGDDCDRVREASLMRVDRVLLELALS